MFDRRPTRATPALCGAVLLVAATAGAQSTDTAYLRGEPLRRALAEPIGVSWSGRSLRSVVESLAASRQAAVVVDRRVDPNQTIELSLSATPLATVLERLAAGVDCGVVTIGDAVLIAPRATAAVLPQTIAARNAEANAAPAELRSALAASRSLEWNDLAEPRAVLRQLVGEAGLRWTNEAAVPHDLLYRATVPSATLVERLSLVAAGFGLTYRLDPTARTLELVPLPAADAVPATPRPAPSTPPPARPAAPGTQVHTLTVQGVPLGKLVEVLRTKHGLKIRCDDEAIRAAGLSTDRLTAVSVENATLVELAEQAAAPLGLTATLDGDTVIIRPK